MARTANQLKLLDVLRSFEKTKKLFTIADLAAETGYTENSIRKYINEKLNGIYVNSLNMEEKWK